MPKCNATLSYTIIAFSSGAFFSTITATVLDRPSLLRTGEYQLLLGPIALPGVFLGIEVFKPVQNSIGIQFVFIIAARIGLLGIIVTAIFIPDTTKSDLAREDEEWRLYLLANSMDGLMGDGSVKKHKASDFVPTFEPHLYVIEEMTRQDRKKKL